MSNHQLDRAVLDEIVRRIVEVAQPERIILFGSAAREEMSRDSDIDLLVVKDGVDRRRLAARIYRRLYGVGAAVDVIVVTPADLKRYGNSHALVVKQALREGTVVYDAADATSASALAAIADWGPAEDWSDWSRAADTRKAR